MSCEMTRYIRPDSAFMWRRNNEVIQPAGRFSILYDDLAPGRAQNGGESLTFSRRSSLVIANVNIADAGIYTCFVSGENASAEIELIIEPTTDSTIDPTDVTSMLYK